MKIGIHLGCSLEKISIEEQIRLMKENGLIDYILILLR